MPICGHIEADPLQIKELFTNILNNAYEALVDKRGKISVQSEKGKGRLKKPFAISDLITQIETILANKKDKNRQKKSRMSDLDSVS